METMTPNRVYVTVGGNDIQKITYMDSDNMRTKTIEFDHDHNGMRPHVHHGYFHNENDGIAGGAKPNAEEQEMIDRVTKIWSDYNSGR